MLDLFGVGVFGGVNGYAVFAKRRLDVTNMRSVAVII
jgi:hypothetical protein